MPEKHSPRNRASGCSRSGRVPIITGTAARALEPGGTVHAIDVQPEMIDHLRERMAAGSRRDVESIAGDARSLPYRDDSFDAAVAVLVLGEIPDRERALAKLYRVLKPGGRLVVGEFLLDPHYVTAGWLRRRGDERGVPVRGTDRDTSRLRGRLSVPQSGIEN